MNSISTGTATFSICRRARSRWPRPKKTPCQAFRHGDKAYGFQFHFEVTQEGVASMADAFAKELVRENIPADRMIAQAAEF